MCPKLRRSIQWSLRSTTIDRKRYNFGILDNHAGRSVLSAGCVTCATTPYLHGRESPGLGRVIRTTVITLQIRGDADDPEIIHLISALRLDKICYLRET